jgi:hypothetical protein
MVWHIAARLTRATDEAEKKALTRLGRAAVRVWRASIARDARLARLHTAYRRRNR